MLSVCWQEQSDCCHENTSVIRSMTRSQRIGQVRTCLCRGWLVTARWKRDEVSVKPCRLGRPSCLCSYTPRPSLSTTPSASPSSPSSAGHQHSHHHASIGRQKWFLPTVIAMVKKPQIYTSASCVYVTDEIFKKGASDGLYKRRVPHPMFRSHSLCTVQK